jgi:hypothetical protein
MARDVVQARQSVAAGGRLVSAPRTLPLDAPERGRLTLLFDLDPIDLTNPLTNVRLSLEVFRDGAWRFDAGCHRGAGVHRNRDGTVRTEADGPDGFRIWLVERDPVTGRITRDLRGQTIRGVVESETAVQCGITTEIA